MPMLVGAFLNEMLDSLVTGLGIASITKLPGVGAKSTAQVAFLIQHVEVRLRMPYGQRFQSGSGTPFGSHSGTRDRSFKVSS